MTERMICLDIELDGKDLDKAERIRRRVAARTPKSGGFYYRDENRWSAIVGGEKAALTRIAQKKVNGVLLGVDGIYEGGINVAAKVTSEEVERLRQDPSYRISTDIALKLRKS